MSFLYGFGWKHITFFQSHFFGLKLSHVCTNDTLEIDNKPGVNTLTYIYFFNEISLNEMNGEAVLINNRPSNVIMSLYEKGKHFRNESHISKGCSFYPILTCFLQEWGVVDIPSPYARKLFLRRKQRKQTIMPQELLRNSVLTTLLSRKWRHLIQMASTSKTSTVFLTYHVSFSKYSCTHTAVKSFPNIPDCNISPTLL